MMMIDPPTSPNGDSQNAGGGKSSKGKLDSIKQEDDIKKEFMDDGSGGDNSQQESSAGVGKNVNNDGTAKLEIKSEDGDMKIKTEPMEVEDSNANSGGAGSDTAMCTSSGDSKDTIKPMTDGSSGSGDVKVKTETKPVVPEPLMPNAGDKKKKCGKYSVNQSVLREHLNFANNSIKILKCFMIFTENQNFMLK